MNVLRNSFIVMLVILFNSCKETCYTCRTPCVSFENHVFFYCLDVFESSAEYNSFIDSLKLIYPVEEEFQNPNSFCEDAEDKLYLLNSFGWSCEEQ